MSHSFESQPNPLTDRPVLVTGATGYVAGRLIPLLLESGCRVRAMGRSLEKMGARPWARHPKVQLIKGDIQDTASLERAVEGCGTIYYLVHSMISQKKAYRDADRIGAQIWSGPHRLDMQNISSIWEARARWTIPISAAIWSPEMRWAIS
ncbi:NAD(P)H-binding protein [uncultured Desulfobacter sp.]|uniref:NmrA family NAD(P)-binding protein n=1 Tax=uncultured Desulfobacter sp. TaxID=240139 RepID=UPI0029F4808D|nr:NAD(P)H-binding protein [uncultured Desulfobacter sp.]